MLGIDDEYRVGHPKKKILTVALENREKPDVKRSIEKLYFT